MITFDAPLGYAFAAGMFATVNPCGFAMLPAYLGYFLGIEGAERNVRAGVTKAVQVSLAVSAGFLLVFTTIGVVLKQLSISLSGGYPWATIIVGVVLLGFGIAMLFGFEPVVSLPKLERGGRERSNASMFVFGVSYAVASLSCALPLFTSTVVGTFRRGALASSMAVFVAYALGMALVLTALTVSLAVAEQGLLHGLRRMLPFITRISGGLLVLAGGYLAIYGWHELQIRDDPTRSSSVVDLVTDWSVSVQSWISDTGPNRLGLLLALGLCAVLVLVVGTKQRRRS